MLILKVSGIQSNFPRYLDLYPFITPKILIKLLVNETFLIKYPCIRELFYYLG